MLRPAQQSSKLRNPKQVGYTSHTVSTRIYFQIKQHSLRKKAAQSANCVGGIAYPIPITNYTITMAVAQSPAAPYSQCGRAHGKMPVFL